MERRLLRISILTTNHTRRATKVLYCLNVSCHPIRKDKLHAGLERPKASKEKVVAWCNVDQASLTVIPKVVPNSAMVILAKPSPISSANKVSLPALVNIVMQSMTYGLAIVVEIGAVHNCEWVLVGDVVEFRA